MSKKYEMVVMVDGKPYITSGIVTVAIEAVDEKEIITHLIERVQRYVRREEDKGTA